MRNRLRTILLLSAPAFACAQSQPDLNAILERLERLEQQNRELRAELESMRKQLPHVEAQPTLAERVEVQERRTEELAQSKLESEHRLPIQVTGMALFNAYWNGRNSGDTSHPTTASASSSQPFAGATLRQTIVGLKFQGPRIFAGGSVNGTVYVDFFAGTASSLNQLARIRTASLNLDWKDTTIMVGQDKPILAPREATSLAQVGVTPLTAAGNLWLWMPQARLEQRFHFGDSAGLRAQVGVFQTNENTSNVPAEYLTAFSRARPGWQSRFEFWRDLPGGRHISIAPGLHHSRSIVEDRSLPANVYAVDWLIRPHARLDFSGQFFSGRNTQTLGGLRPGITFFADGSVRPVRSQGGWAQLSFRATARTSFNLYGGQEAHPAADLLPGAIQRNRAYAANIMYKLGSNVLAAFEAYQARTTYLGSGTRLIPHYDFALAYLF